MTTFQELRKAAESIGSAFTDSNTPAGHFGVTMTILGITTVYLLEGKVQDPEAIVKGRIELKPFTMKGSNVYVGNGIKGGEWVGGSMMFAEAFAKMV